LNNTRRINISMDPYLLAASILLILITLNHLIAGEIYILIPLFKSKEIPGLMGELGPSMGVNSQAFMRRVIRMAWYVTVIPWIGSSYLFCHFANNGIDTTGVIVLQVLAAVYFGTAVVVAIFTRGRHLSIFLFLAIAYCIWISVI